jgi:hypothetical protein
MPALSFGKEYGMKNRAASSLVTAAVASGVLMAAYLLLRPYGDVQGRQQEVAAMASTLWVVSHSCGMLALASFASLVLRLSHLDEGWVGRVGHWSAQAGLVLVLPYYGAETFALHVIARHSATEPGSMDLVELIRNQPVGMTAFGTGLLLLAVSGICLAMMWRSVTSRTGRWAAAPLGVLMALLLPQFFWPPAGRMAYGVLFLAAAGGFALAARSPQIPGSVQALASAN